MKALVGTLSLTTALLLFVFPLGLILFVTTIVAPVVSQSQGPCSLAPGSGAWTQPTVDADGVVGSPFGMRFHPILGIWRLHNGVDLGNSRGTPIWSVADGTVTAANDGCAEGNGSCNGGAGNNIAVDHGGATTTKYLHLLTGSITVRVGDRVTAGQQIAQMGSTGLSTAPHLHFAVQVNGEYTDPDAFLRQRGVTVASTTSPAAGVPTVDALAATGGTPAATGTRNPTSVTSRTTSGTSVVLGEQQLQLAATIIGVGQQLGVPQRGIQVALVTALQESALGANPGTGTPDTNGDVGPFQQRSLVGWYAPQHTQAANVTWLNDGRNAATVFFAGQTVSAEVDAAARSAGATPAGPVGYQLPGLLTVPGWETLPVGVAAQKVQRSAYPDAYASWEPVAADIMAAVQGVLPGGGCGASPGGAIYAPGDIPQSDRPVGSEARLTPATVIVLRAVAALFPEITTIGGWRATSAIAGSDHPFGRAIDVMIPDYRAPAQIALGDRIADFVIANHEALHIKYVIWRQRTWTPQNPTWRPMADRGSDTANHLDHVHVSVLAN